MKEHEDYVSLVTEYMKIHDQKAALNPRLEALGRAVELANIKWRAALGDWDVRPGAPIANQELCGICQTVETAYHVKDLGGVVVWTLCEQCKDVDPITALLTP